MHANDIFMSQKLPKYTYFFSFLLQALYICTYVHVRNFSTHYPYYFCNSSCNITRSQSMDFPKRKHNYLLCAVLCHFGEIQSGHYVTYRRHRDHWYFTSDADVRRCQTSGKYKSKVLRIKSYVASNSIFFLLYPFRSPGGKPLYSILRKAIRTSFIDEGSLIETKSVCILNTNSYYLYEINKFL